MKALVIGALAAVLALSSARAQNAAQPTFSPQVVQADFDELYARMQASHFDLFARRPKAEFDRFFQSMRGSFVRPMSRFEVEVAFQRFLAFGNVAHARIEFPSEAFGAFRDKGGKTLPLSTRVAKGAVFVDQNQSGTTLIAPGDEVVALDGQPIAAWLTRLAAHVSADNQHMANTLLENRFARLLWLEVGERQSFTLRMRKVGGDVVVPARTRAESERFARPEPAWDRREAKMLPNGVAYLLPGPFFNSDPNAVNMWDATAFSAFIDNAFRGFIKAGARSLIIDLRDNPGGDNSFSDLMMHWYATKPFKFASEFRIKVSQAAIDSNAARINSGADTSGTSVKLASAYRGKQIGSVVSFDIPVVEPRAGERYTGKVFVLINRRSYSNTVQVAASSQDYRFATILGEETADLATTYGAMEQFTLSRTAIPVGFPKALIVRANGSLAPRGVTPDIAIETPIVPNGDDIVLRRAAEIAGR